MLSAQTASPVSADAFERVMADDRQFFDEHPDRVYRMRLMSSAEIAQVEVACGGRICVPPRLWAYVIVRSIAPGLRARAFMCGPPHLLRADVPEQLAAALFAKGMGMRR